MLKQNKNRRNKAKYPGLQPEFNLKPRIELIDQEYAKTLPDKKIKHCNNPNKDCKKCANPKTRYINPKEWLNAFNEEYVNDILDRKNLKNNLHNNKKLKKDCDDRNNSRNRDIFTQHRASGSLTSIENLKDSDHLTENPEDILLRKEAIEEYYNLKNKK